jgi:1,5-anhydro-D-fructose reductase (1,5-anhydro-D-mannitol-forming)
MNRKPRLKVAIMSFAHVHSLSYASLLQDYDDVELRTSDPGPHPAGEVRGLELAQQLGVAYVDTYEELLAWGPDAVIVTAENTRHRVLVEAAAAAGAHILCEKPIATSLEDAVAMREAVQRAGVSLMVAMPMRFSSSFRTLVAAHAAGDLGEIVAIHGSNNSKLPSERAWFTDPSLSGGGALIDHIVHIADLIAELTRARPVSVTAIVNRALNAERARAETGALVTLSYDDGMIAAIDSSWSQPETAPTWGGLALTADGTEGSISIDFFRPRLVGLDSTTGIPIEIPYGPDFDDAMLRAFLDGVRDGAAPEPGPDAAIDALRIVLAAQESAARGTTVALPPPAQ